MTDLGTPTTHGRRRKTSAVPRWARICTIFGTVLIVLSGVVLVGFEALLSRYQGAVASADLFGDEGPGSPPPKVSDIKGPINILLVGIDPRQPSTPPLADSIMILHVPAGMDRAYLFSMPRDLRVDIPAFPEANYAGGNDRLNAAMSHGSLVPGKNPDAAKGFELLQTTISNYTGIKRFDAGAILNFGGFKKIVDAMGGVDMYIDADTKSEHLRPDGTPGRATRTARATSGRSASTRRARPTSTAGRRWTTYASARRWWTATTGGSDTSSSSSGRWPARRSAGTW